MVMSAPLSIGLTVERRVKELTTASLFGAALIQAADLDRYASMCGR
jgi:hypothetical protein